MPPAELPCGQIVFRSLSRAQHIDRENKRLLPAAFIRRDPPRDAAGLSVNYNMAPTECYESLKKCYGVASLHVGKVRDMGLDVIADTDNHANVVNLPYPADDEVQAEWLAGRLAKHARLVLLADGTRPGTTG